MIRLEAIDLNLLLAFETLAAERNVTRAAARLHMSQPAMSGALARLRVLFDDPLFVRRDRQMCPTPRARQLVGPIAEAVGGLREALEQDARFDPRTFAHTVTVVATDYVETLFAGPLATALRREAPAISVRFVRPPEAFLPPDALLRAGEADLALGLFTHTMRPGSDLLTHPLLQDRIVAIVRAGHARVGRTLGLRAFARMPQIRILYPNTVSVGFMDTALASLGQDRNVVLTVANFVSVPAIVARSDLLGLVPERLARLWARAFRLRVLEIPVRLPELPLAMVWHSSHHRDASQAWVRGVISRELSRQERPSPPRVRRGIRISRA